MEEHKADTRTGWWNDPALRVAIVAGILASIVFIYFLDPILRGLWSVALFAARRLYSGLLDGVYTHAALGHRDWLLVLLFLMGHGALSGAIVGAIAGTGIRWLKPEGFKRPRRIVAALVLFVSVWIPLTFIAVLAFADVQLNASFNQRLTVLAPRLSEQERKEFLAMWASMTSRQDYERLNARLEQVATSRSVKLPPPLLK
jgi:hypothetical protein